MDLFNLESCDDMYEEDKVILTDSLSGNLTFLFDDLDKSYESMEFTFMGKSMENYYENTLTLCAKLNSKATGNSYEDFYYKNTLKSKSTEDDETSGVGEEKKEGFFKKAWEAIKGFFRKIGKFFEGFWNNMKTFFKGKEAEEFRKKSTDDIAKKLVAIGKEINDLKDDELDAADKHIDEQKKHYNKISVKFTKLIESREFSPLTKELNKKNEDLDKLFLTYQKTLIEIRRNPSEEAKEKKKNFEEELKKMCAGIAETKEKIEGISSSEGFSEGSAKTAAINLKSAVEIGNKRYVDIPDLSDDIANDKESLNVFRIVGQSFKESAKIYAEIATGTINTVKAIAA